MHTMPALLAQIRTQLCSKGSAWFNISLAPRGTGLGMTPLDNWTPLCSVKSHFPQSPYNQLEDQSLLSAVQSVACGEWLEVANQTLQRREA